MMKRPRLKAIFLLLLAGCLFLPTENPDCAPLPMGFLKEDLIGEWVYHDISGESDRLVIEDTRYKQILDLKEPVQDYESDWLPWRLEIAESGIAYLYLEGMNACLYSPFYDCDTIQDGFPDSVFFGWDYCAGQSLTTTAELVLIARGTLGTVQPPRGIVLTSLQISTEGGTTGYELQNSGE